MPRLIAPVNPLTCPPIPTPPHPTPSLRPSSLPQEVAGVVASVDGVKLATVDCAASESKARLCASQHINAFPSIMLYKGRVPHTHVHFHGDRTVQLLLDFLVAAQQDDSLTTDPKAATTLEAHAASERIAHDLQLLAGANGSAPAAGHDHGAAGGAAAAAAAAAMGGRAPESTSRRRSGARWARACHGQITVKGG